MNVEADDANHCRMAKLINRTPNWVFVCCGNCLRPSVLLVSGCEIGIVHAYCMHT